MCALAGVDDPQLGSCDVVVVPSEHPAIAEQIRHRAKVIELGNVLDAASQRMVSEIVDELRA